MVFSFSAVVVIYSQFAYLLNFKKTNPVLHYEEEESFNLTATEKSAGIILILKSKSLIWYSLLFNSKKIT
jgi:hypothetical protein